MMKTLLLVVLGSGLGGGARWLVGFGAARLLGAAFPYGTLLVNFTGSMALSLVMQAGARGAVSPEARVFLATGFMGGFTTYSTFNFETLQLLERGAWPLATTNIVLTLSACLLGGALGTSLWRALA